MKSQRRKATRGNLNERGEEKKEKKDKEKEEIQAIWHTEAAQGNEIRRRARIGQMKLHLGETGAGVCRYEAGVWSYWTFISI